MTGPTAAAAALSVALLAVGLRLWSPQPERPQLHRMMPVGRIREGDVTAEPVLECLSQLVGLYGDSLVVVQYLPHCWDLVSRHG